MYPSTIAIARTAVSLSHDSEHWDSAFEKALAQIMAPKHDRVWRRCAGKVFVKSASGRGWYVVKEGYCNCTAAQFGRLCWHKALYELLASVEGR